MAKKSGLGRGLDSLFLENVEEKKNMIETVKVSLIDPKPDQPRKFFDQEALAQLADSISCHGVLQPIIVREMTSGRYEIVAGERRWRATKLAGLTEIPAVVIDEDDLKAAEISIVENIQREDLNPLEEAQAYRALATQYGMTQEQISGRVGKSRSAVANALRLLDLPEDVWPLLSAGQLSGGHARTLLGLRDRSLIPALAKKVAETGMSVRELEAEVKRLNKPSREKPAADTGDVNYVADLENRLFRSLGRKVKIKDKGQNKSITLFYDDNLDLEILLQQLCGKSFTDEV